MAGAYLYEMCNSPQPWKHLCQSAHIVVLQRFVTRVGNVRHMHVYAASYDALYVITQTTQYRRVARLASLAYPWCLPVSNTLRKDGGEIVAILDLQSRQRVLL